MSDLAGFQIDPSKAHIERSEVALRELADFVNTCREPGDIKRIKIGHLINNGMLNFALYGFPIRDFSPDGHLVDDTGPDALLKFALLINHPVPTQVQYAISFLAAFVGRQAHIEPIKLAGDETSMRNLDLTVHDLDRQVRQQVQEDLVESWQTTARRTVRQASEIGLRFQIEYAGDLLPRREDAAARVSLGRIIYNTFPTVRKAIDAAVADIAGREPQIKGGPELVRAELQQKTAASFLTRYIN
ncbi:MAG: hypothetical protein ACRDHX_06945, partial [Chloroflexota bacterium]